MKKLILAFLTAVITLSSSANNSSENVKPGRQVIETFNSNFPSVSDVVWRYENKIHVARFINQVNNGKATAAYYSADGEYLGHAWSISLNELPSIVKQELLHATKSEEVKTLAIFFSPESYPSYVATIEHNGKRITRKIDSYGQARTISKRRSFTSKTTIL